MMPPENLRSTTSSWPSLRLTSMALIVAMGSSFSFGFQLLITNPAQNAFLNFLNASKGSRGSPVHDFKQLENEWSFIVATLFLGSASGAFLIRTISEKLGRKKGISLAVFAQVAASALSIISFWTVNHFIFTFARFLMGIGITISMGIAAMFVTEASPVHCRGVSSLINGVILQFSLLLGAVMAMPKILGRDDLLWLLYLFQLIINSGVLLCLPSVHDSPGFLSSKSNLPHSIASLKHYHDISDREATELASGLIETHQSSRSQESIISLWKSSFNRRGTLLGMLVTFSMAMSGITVINAFAFEILMSTGLEQDSAAIANSCVCFFSFAGILVSTKIIDRCGRRPLLISTFASLTIVNCFIVVFIYINSVAKSTLVSYLLIIAICLFNFLFAMGPGPLSMFITGELVSQNCRSASSVWTNAVMAIMRFLILAFFMPVKNAVSEWAAYAIFFILPMMCAVFVLLFLLPETKGRNSEDLRTEYRQSTVLLKDVRTDS